MSSHDESNMIPSMINDVMSIRSPQMNGGSEVSCRDAFNHVENCPICSSYFKKDIKFYWLIIAILVIIIILLTRNGIHMGGK